MIIAVATPCIVAYLFLRTGRLERIVAWLWLAGAALALFGTGSRTGLIAAVIGLGTAFALALLAHPAQPLARFRLWAAHHRLQAASIIVPGGAVALLALAAALYVQFGRPFQDDGGGRLSFYRSALGMFAAHPLTGAGPGGFFRNEVQTHSVPPWKPLSHAHQMLLHTAAESGLIGLIGLVALLFAAAWTCYTVWRRRPSRRPLITGPIGGLVAFVITGLADTPTNQFAPFFLVALLLAYIASLLPPPGGLHRTRVRLIVVAVCGVILLFGFLIVYSVHGTPLAGATTEDAAQQLDAISAYDLRSAGGPPVCLLLGRRCQ
jgi:O-antigen ligase